ncbi:hypothetical protein [Demequina silvatica]|uniref:hypothetical protein n=1 Tax=Demequina silvatica TaxID=1638988 RepID=UPI000782CDF1|nr:hypothetical protein [Demequina silvatica]
MSAAIARYQSSELSRNSKVVFEAADLHAVEITRRDAAPLVLMSRREADARDALLQIAGQLITAMLGHEGDLATRLSQIYPWMLALSAADRAVCAQDLIDAARASFSTGQPHLALAEMLAWRETATATAAGLGSDPIEWLDEPRQVERP